MLEYASIKKFSWQNASKIKDYHELSRDLAIIELLDVFSEIIKQASNDNITSLIWSNESFLSRSANVIPALKVLQNNKMISLKIIVYVREYTEWSQSAYLQWGLKHKAQKGRIKDFNSWKGSKSLPFYSAIRSYLYAFPGEVIVRNMDGIDDIVDDFLLLCNINPKNIIKKRINDAPSNEELFLRTLPKSVTLK